MPSEKNECHNAILDVQKRNVHKKNTKVRNVAIPGMKENTRPKIISLHLLYSIVVTENVQTWNNELLD